MVAGCEFGCGDGIALGVEEAHGVFGEVAAVGSLPFVVEVGEDGADRSVISFGFGGVGAGAGLPGNQTCVVIIRLA